MLERQPSLKHTRTLSVNTERSASYVPVSKQMFEKVPKLTLIAHIHTHHVYTQTYIFEGFSHVSVSYPVIWK